LANELVYKIYLLQEETVRKLYQQILSKNLSEYPIASKIKSAEEHKNFCKKAADKTIGTK
jgi:hypothetical protein